MSMKKISIYIFPIILFFFTGCEPDVIAPPNQGLAFIKYFGHVLDQQASDIKRTPDLGYILVGSTNAYSTSSDIFIVKTDQEGNELWSVALGENPPSGTDYGEDGIGVVVLADGSYVIAGNKKYINTSGANPVIERTKIVMYKLAIDGSIEVGPITLRESDTNHSDEVAEMEWDRYQTANVVVLTGNTTNVTVGKPGGPFPATDFKDIFTARVDVDNNFDIPWNTSLAYGFDGEDYGVSVQVLTTGYVVVGHDQQAIYKDNGEYRDNIRLVQYDRVSGGINNTIDEGNKTNKYVGGYSTIDTVNNRITVFSTSLAPTSPNISLQFGGEAVIMQTDFDLVVRTFPRPVSLSNALPLTNTGKQQVYSRGIDFVDDDDGFVLSMTVAALNSDNSVAASDMAVTKLDNNLNQEAGWPFYAGFQSSDNGGSTFQDAASIIVVQDTVAGSNKKVLSGYAMTGTFDLESNTMLGLVKLNTTGTLEPK